jgi:hypothetical protein
VDELSVHLERICLVESFDVEPSARHFVMIPGYVIRCNTWS